MTIQHTCSFKHLTLSERAEIEVMIDKGSSFAQIARTLSRDPSTISKEIRSHRFLVPHYRMIKAVIDLNVSIFLPATGNIYADATPVIPSVPNAAANDVPFTVRTFPQRYARSS